MNTQILEYFGYSHASHIHARGKLSTNKLIELLEAQENEKILEIGFGTGATIIQMAAQSKAQFFGYELSSLMYQKALKRIHFCNMQERIKLALLESKNQFPVPDNTFDRIYAESILAIQENNDFLDLLLEIKRVLKPNGIFLFNETIWLDTVSRSKAKQINSVGKMSFGIIQSNHDYLHIDDWKNLLTEIGFKHELEVRVADLVPVKESLSWTNFYSNIFTLIGKVKATASVTMRRSWKNFQVKMRSINNSQEKLMEGVILKAYNDK